MTAIFPPPDSRHTLKGYMLQEQESKGLLGDPVDILYEAAMETCPVVEDKDLPEISGRRQATNSPNF